jgi:hypothetical protein
MRTICGNNLNDQYYSVYQNNDSNISIKELLDDKIAIFNGESVSIFSANKKRITYTLTSQVSISDFIETMYNRFISAKYNYINLYHGETLTRTILEPNFSKLCQIHDNRYCLKFQNMIKVYERDHVLICTVKLVLPLQFAFL